MSKGFGDWNSSNSGFTSSNHAPHKSCYHSHPALPVVVPAGGKYTEGTYLIYGGNANTPIHKDCDVYIGLDGSTSGYGKKPWQGVSEVVDVTWYITDMQAPKDAEDFKLMIQWVCNQLQSGKKIHFGCIGGHGRTGTALSAVIAEMTGNMDAVAYVRKNYCHKAVESNAQVAFLKKHWGVNSISGAKEGVKSHGSNHAGTQASWGFTAPAKHTQLGGDSSKKKGSSFSKSKRTITMAPSAKSIFG